MCAALPLALPPKPPNADLAVVAWPDALGLTAGCFAPASVPTGSVPSLLCGCAPLDRSSRPPWIQFTLFYWVGGASCEPSGCPPKVGERISPEELCTLSDALSC